MKVLSIDDSKIKSKLTVVETEDFEFQDPVEVTFSINAYSYFQINKDIISTKFGKFSELSFVQAILKKDAKNRAQKFIDEYLVREVPQYLNWLLACKSKKDQLKVLKNKSLTLSDLTSLFLQSGSKGYKLSHYRSEYGPEDIDKSDLPFFASIEEQVRKYGETKLSDGQLKHYVDFRMVLVAKFLDKGDSWHCFFWTLKSIGGQERTYKDGQAHIHYISSYFGMTREKVLKELRNRKYKLGSLPHIDLIKG